jgi:cell division protein ZapA (FtsZ GTPase activity inhibitor)
VVFLAQEVQQVFPGCVKADEDGYLSLNIHDIIIASINAMKELDAKNAKLQSENDTLKAKLQQHEEKLAYILDELAKGR